MAAAILPGTVLPCGADPGGTRVRRHQSGREGTMRLLRNLARRRLRTGLTVAGITIGVWALVVFSSMANRIDSIVAGGEAYFEGRVLVTDASGDALMNAAPMSAASAERIARVPGVAIAIPQVSMMLDPQDMGMTMGNVEMIAAGPPIPGEADRVGLRVASGRMLTADDTEDVVVLGADLARRSAVAVGGTLEVQGRPFTVIGILEPTLGPGDTTALMPLAPGQELYAASLPAAMRGRLPVTDLATQITVIPADGVSVTDLAARIEAALPAFHAMTAESFREDIGSSVALLNAIIVGVALISLVVGGLSIINTMAMAVQERTREIGIKRAIGGSRARVVRELVGEAALIGLVGGLIGLGLGALVVWLSNEAGRASATVLFELTAGTAVFALAFSTILGVVAGTFPALSAARLDPVQAIRHE